MTAPALSYRVEGSVLVIVVRGTPTPEDRTVMYDAIARDANVRPGSLVLIDRTEADRVTAIPSLQERAHALVQFLGPKLGAVCAVVAPAALLAEANLFQAAMGELGLHAEVFTCNVAAREWLSTFASVRHD